MHDCTKVAIVLRLQYSGEIFSIGCPHGMLWIADILFEAEYCLCLRMQQLQQSSPMSPNHGVSSKDATVGICKPVRHRSSTKAKTALQDSDILPLVQAGRLKYC